MSEDTQIGGIVGIVVIAVVSVLVINARECDQTHAVEETRQSQAEQQTEQTRAKAEPDRIRACLAVCGDRGVRDVSKEGCSCRCR